MFDKKKEFDRLLNDKLTEIINICNENEIPCFMTFGIRQKENSNIECNSKSLLPELFGIEGDRLFSDHINVQNGFTTLPPASKDEIDISDISFPQM